MRRAGHCKRTQSTTGAGIGLLVVVAVLLSAGIVYAPVLRGASVEKNRNWTFVSIPDFLNADTTYPQPGWEDALSYANDYPQVR